MDILILAQAHFPAQHLAQQALARGWRVHWCGQEALRMPPALGLVNDLCGPREQLAARLKGVNLAACVDFSAEHAADVEQLQPLMERGCQRYVLMGDGRVYADCGDRALDENAARVPAERRPGAADANRLAGNETAALSAFGSRATLLRSAPLVGPLDPVGELTWWLDRARRGGRLLCPAPSASSAQWLDARDLAAFVLTAIERELSGAFNLAGPGRGVTLAELVTHLAGFAEEPLEPQWVDPSFLLDQGLKPGSDLPLWSPEDRPRRLPILDASRALAAGLAPRPLAETLADLLLSLESGATAPAAPRGLSPEREQRLLKLWQAELAHARRTPVGAEI
jgi:nucleoside-diphosphate-sugar epimerase